MNNSKAFGTALSRIRKEQGFSSAHQFFKSVGGSKSLGLAFMSYWDMERGKKLPKSWRLKAIMAALGIAPYTTKAQELVRAYFRALSGSDELIQFLAAPAAPARDLPGRDLAEAATHKALEQLTVNLTLDQWKARTRDLVTHICQCYLANTAGWVTVKEVADVTKFKPDAVQKALKALADGGLIEFSKDKARGLFAGKMIQLLPVTPATAMVRHAIKKNWDAWLEGSSRVAMKRMTVRMTKAGLNAYRQHLAKAVNLSAVYDSAEEHRQASAIYLIDASIFQVLPREVAKEEEV